LIDLKPSKMYFTTALVTLFAGLGLALPTVEERQTYVPCSGLYGNAQCCATDVLGVADLDCGDVPAIPTSGDNFSAVCAEMGQRARCCVLPIVSGLDFLPPFPRDANDEFSWSKASFATPPPACSTPSRDARLNSTALQAL
jgi:hypothetical protein